MAVTPNANIETTATACKTINKLIVDKKFSLADPNTIICKASKIIKP